VSADAVLAVIGYVFEPTPARRSLCPLLSLRPLVGLDAFLQL
jgi:hypothetical protein